MLSAVNRQVGCKNSISTAGISILSDTSTLFFKDFEPMWKSLPIGECDLFDELLNN